MRCCLHVACVRYARHVDHPGRWRDSDPGTQQVNTLLLHNMVPMFTPRQLLARICLVREEAKWLDVEVNFTLGAGAVEGEAGTEDGAPRPVGPVGSSTAAMFTRQQVPQRCIVFLKVRLLLLTSSDVGCLPCTLLGWSLALSVESSSGLEC